MINQSDCPMNFNFSHVFYSNLVVHRYEKRYTDDLLKEEEVKVNSFKETTSRPDVKQATNQIKASTSASEQDLDVFLLGDLGDSDDGGPGNQNLVT